MSCSLCPSTQIHPERNAGSTSCWFGEEGLYHWQPVQPQQQDDSCWVFGLEDQYFPLSPPEAEPPEQPSAVEGLTEEFLQFLEKRLAQVDEVVDEEENDTVLADLPITSPVIDAAKPIPPIRRRRLQRSMSLQVVKVTPTPVIRSRTGLEYPEDRQIIVENEQEFVKTRTLGRSGSIASDLIQRVKRWAAVTSTFRRAFRKVAPHEPPVDERFLFKK